jgi:hypothetical protein
MDDRERRLAEQMADHLRDLIKEFESLGPPVPEWVSARLALIRRLLADLESNAAIAMVSFVTRLAALAIGAWPVHVLICVTKAQSAKGTTKGTGSTWLARLQIKPCTC